MSKDAFKTGGTSPPSLPLTGWAAALAYLKFPPSPEEPVQRIKTVLRTIFLAPPLDEITLTKRAWKLNAALLAGRNLSQGWDVISLPELTLEEERTSLENFLPAFCEIPRTEEEQQAAAQTPETLKRWAQWDKQAAKRANRTGELPTGWKWCAYDECHGAFKPSNASQRYCSPRCRYRAEQAGAKAKEGIGVAAA